MIAKESIWIILYIALFEKIWLSSLILFRLGPKNSFKTVRQTLTAPYFVHPSTTQLYELCPEVVIQMEMVSYIKGETDLV